MKRELKLWIDGTEAQVLQDAQRISFVYSIEGTQPGAVGGSYAKRSLTLPGTKTNHAIFENIDQAPAVVTDAHKLLPARAEVNGVPILAGRAQLDKAILGRTGHGLKANAYQVSFVGNNADWFQLIGALLVRDLAWDDFTLTSAGFDSQTNSNPMLSQGCFIAMRWKPWEDETRVSYPELTPALFLRQILTKAFQTIGYKLEGVFDVDPFRRLCIPVPLKLDGDYAANFINVRASVEDYIVSNFLSLTTQIIFDDDSTPPNVDGGNNYNTLTGEYTVPIAGVYTVRVTGENTLTGYIDDPGGTRTNRLYVYKNGVKIPDSYVDLPLFGPFEFEDIFEFEIGDVIEIWYECEQVIGTGGPVITWDMDATLSIEAEKDRWEMGEVLEYSNIIPGTWMIKDIIKDITQVFNLAWETDVLSQVVTVWPRDAFNVTYRADGDGAATTSAYEGFYKRTDQNDITGKIDISRGGELNIITDRVQDYVLAWGTGDETVRAVEERSASNLYSARYRFPDDRFPKGAQWLYTSFFAKTIHIQDTGISSGVQAVQIPLVYGKDYTQEPDAEPDYGLNPRLLYFAGRRGGDDGYIRLYDPTTSAESPYDLPAAWQVNYNDPSAVDWSLSFSDEVTNFGGTVKGLFKTLHLHNARRIEEGRRYSVFVNWNEGDIAALSFRSALTVDASRFLLEKIDGFTPLSQGPTKTEMILDIMPAVTDAAKVSGPVLLQGATPGALTTLGSITGVIGAAGQTVRVLRYRQLIQNATTNIITLPGTSGLLDAPDAYIAITINQNGKILMPVLEYTISGLTITVDALTHFEGCNYHIMVHETL